VQPELGLRRSRPAPAPGRRRDRLLRLNFVALLAFLYVPILVLVGLSFNGSGLPTSWGGFSTRWYGELLRSSDLIDSFRTTLIVASAVTVISSVLGTLLALGLERTVRSTLLDSVLFLPAVVPDIVLAIGLLSFFTLAKVSLGLHTVIASHVVFDMIFVAAIVRTRLGYFDRSVEDAAQDLGADRIATFLRVTVPLIAPGIVAGALVAFTLSFDEFIIAFFTSGPTSITFPIRVYSKIRFGVTPVINAVATVTLVVSFTTMLIAMRLNGRAARRGARLISP
jgi:spermidine/putrescine transport system permease protein